MSIKNYIVAVTFTALGLGTAFSQTVTTLGGSSVGSGGAGRVEYAALGGALGGVLGNKAKESGQANDGGFNIAQLTPGGIKILKAYGYYFESYGKAEAAGKMRAAAEALEKGGTFDKATKKLMDSGMKELRELGKKEAVPTEEQKALRKKGSDLVKEAVVEWGVVAGTVSAVLAQDPSAALTNPELGIAAALCVKGLGDQIDLAAFVLGEDKKEKKARNQAEK